MKTMGSSRGWLCGIVLGALVPNLALAKLSQAACKSQAEASFRKKSVEVELASMTGEMGLTEASLRRENLHRVLEMDQEKCLRLVHANSAKAGDTVSNML
jgi:hypothetical protein